VTKRGKPVARIVPILPEPGSSYGIAKVSISYDESDDLVSTGESWNAEA